MARVAGLVALAPDATGYGLVDVAGERRRCYFAPARFAAPWPVPTPGMRVAVDLTPAGGGAPRALWLLGQGAPAYSYSGGA